MKKTFSIVSALAMLAVGSIPANAVTYGDATGENFTGAGGGILDITSVEVNATATDLVFKINLAGDPSNPTDWGKYMIGIDSAAGGDTVGNAWGRPISMSSGMDYWVGSWADSGNGAEVWKYTGAWALQNATYATPGGLSISKNTSSVTISYPYASLGLSFGNSFTFDVYTSGSGGGDGAVDALGNPSQSIADWGNPYNSGSLVNTFTVPEPSSLALIGLGGLALVRRSLRRK